MHWKRERTGWAFEMFHQVRNDRTEEGVVWGQAQWTRSREEQFQDW